MIRSALLLVVLAAGCTGSRLLTSRMPVAAVVIDADVSEWEGVLHPVEEEAFSLGVVNDADNLYVAFVSHDQQIARQVLVRGMTFWLDPDGGKEKSIGVRFPVGLLGQGRVAGMQGIERLDQVFDQATSHLEIIEGEQVSRHPALSLPNMGASASMEFGTLTLELRIPLKPGAGFAFAPSADGTIGLGLETTPLDLSALVGGLDASNGTRMGGGRGGFGAAGGHRELGAAGGRGGQQPGQNMTIPEQLKFWTDVALAR